MSNQTRESKRSEAFMQRLSRVDTSDYNRTKRRMLMAVRIAEAMEAKGWKPIDLARAMSKQPSQVSDWLSGTRNFELDTLSDISDTLGVDLFVFNPIQKQLPTMVKLRTTATTFINEAETRKYEPLFSRRLQKTSFINLPQKRVAIEKQTMIK